MNKIRTTILAFFALTTFSFVSCNEYISMSSATKLSQLSGNPFYYQLSKSLLKNIGTFLVEKGLKNTVGKINLTTPLSSILKTTDHISAFKNMLSTAYKVPAKKLDNATFDKVTNIKDLVGFLAKNANHFDFYTSK